MADRTFAGTPVTILRLEQPLCAHDFKGEGCAAVGSNMCYRTRPTCRAISSFALGDPLFLYFAEPGGGRPTDDLAFLPFLESVSLSSPRINVSGSDKRINPLGLLGSGEAKFRDADHSDYAVDPYLSERGGPKGGTFWGRWLPRNTFARAGAKVSVFEGFAGRPLSSYRRRDYLTNGVTHSDGAVTIKLVDMLNKVRTNKAQVPAVSPGYLLQAISEDADAFDVAGALPEDYPEAGTVRINDEAITYSAVEQTATGYLRFSGLGRGSDSTTAAAHGAEDLVQRCIRLDGLRVDEGLALVLKETSVDPDVIPLEDWAQERGDYLAPYILQGLLSEPVAAETLLGEILEQCQACMWFDEEARKVRLWAVKPQVNSAPVLTYERHIVAGSLSVTEYPDRRVSQVWVYYSPRQPALRETDAEDFKRVFASVDLSLEGEDAFDGSAVRKIMARYVGTQAVASETSGRVLARYRFGASEAEFSLLDDDAEGLPIGATVILSDPSIVDEDGARDLRLWVITSRERVPGKRLVKFTAEDSTLSGLLSHILPDDTPDYQGDGSDVEFGAYIGDNEGLLPDGKPCAQIQ